MKTLVIIRGIPGSGKSTEAKKLCCAWLREEGTSCIICSADQHFIDKDTGEYNFDSKLLPKAHASCKSKALSAMEMGIDLIVIDNTNIKKEHYQPYLDLARQYGYKIKEVIIGDFDEASILKYAERNTHGVPLEVVKAMAERFEK